MPPPPPPAVRRRRQGTKGPPPPPPPLPHRPESGRRGAPPPHTHPSWGATGAPPPPPPRRDGDAVRGTAAGPAPANPHRRAGATRTTEQEGGRAPHDPPVTTAHSGMTEGGFRSAGAPGGAVHGPPLTPPPVPGRHFSPDRTRTPEGNAPATRRGPGWSTAGRRPEGEQGGRGATPPPPTPPPARQPRGPRPPPPEAGGMVPPRPRGEPECDSPPRPSRRLPWGPRRTSEPTPAHRDAAQIVPREAG